LICNYFFPFHFLWSRLLRGERSYPPSLDFYHFPRIKPVSYHASAYFSIMTAMTVSYFSFYTGVLMKNTVNNIALPFLRER
jgi:hypothetical protein